MGKVFGRDRGPRRNLLGVIMIAVALAGVGCSSKDPVAPSVEILPDPQANKAAVQRYYAEVLNQRNLTLVDELYSPNYISRDDPSHPYLGTDELRQTILGRSESFPDGVFDLVDLVAEGDKVAVNFLVRGTHLGDFQGIPATGKPVVFRGMRFYRFDGDRIAETWATLDFLSLLVQIEAIPPPVAKVGGDLESHSLQNTDPAANKAVVRRYYDEVLNKRNLALVDELYTPDYSSHDDPSHPYTGTEALRQTIVSRAESFPDGVFDLIDLVAEGDRVVAHFFVRGTHLGDFQGIPPTGKEVVFRGMRFYRFDGNRIAETWAVLDFLNLLFQLDALPLPGPPAEAP